MEVKDTINIAKDFADNPGAREIQDGPNSGEQFYNELLLPKFNKAVEENYLLMIVLDGVFGFPSSFISGSFGKLSMERGKDLCLKHLRFTSEKNPMREQKVRDEIENPTPKK